ncbi:MAG: BON domain-containing protein [Syntrophales bacterium]|nr:BON domain-containing protein [Syntrophales bacterium]
MKKHLMMISYFVILAIVCGCTTVYKAAVDERNVSTIASDNKIAVTVSKRFFDDATIKILDISADCYNGHVYLIGEYENEKQKSRAVKIARGVKGVKSVTTYLLPKKKGDRCGTSDNVAIIAKVKARLIKDKEIWSTNIKVKSVQCNVVLLGIIGSKAEIHKIIDYTKSVEGVRSVKSFLKSIK